MFPFFRQKKSAWLKVGRHSTLLKKSRMVPRLETLEDRQVPSYLFTTIDYPTPVGPDFDLEGINNTGQIVGQFLGLDWNYHGFLYAEGNFTSIAPLGAVGSQALGINDAGQIVGNIVTSNPYRPDGFLYEAGSFTVIDVPGATLTQARGINHSSQIVGIFRTGDTEPYHGFLDTGGSFITIDAPGAGGIVKSCGCPAALGGGLFHPINKPYPGDDLWEQR